MNGVGWDGRLVIRCTSRPPFFLFLSYYSPPIRSPRYANVGPRRMLMECWMADTANETEAGTLVGASVAW